MREGLEGRREKGGKEGERGRLARKMREELARKARREVQLGTHVPKRFQNCVPVNGKHKKKKNYYSLLLHEVTGIPV